MLSEYTAPWVAAGSSFAAFGVGAFVPLLPYLFGAGTAGVLASVILSTAALFGVGASVAMFTGKGALRSGVRTLFLGGAAATVTFLIGKAVGVGVS